jgi:DNA-binding protein H-NS
MSQLKDLLAQAEALQAKIDEARATETSEAIKKAQDLVAEYQLTINDVFPSGKRKVRKSTSSGRSAVAPKYRDPATGKTWSGRGLAPKWLEGKNREDFLIS